MRISTACSQCRTAKRRCISQATDQACIPCYERRLVCEGRPWKKSRSQRYLIPRFIEVASTTSSQPDCSRCQAKPELDLNHGTAIELVDVYLDKFHGRPHIIFHPNTLRLQVRNGDLSKALLYAICAFGCKFSGNPDVRSQYSDLATESRRLLQADISNICIENIQACILIAMLSVGCGDSALEALFFRTYQTSFVLTATLRLVNN